jgi:hypothetical protein
MLTIHALLRADTETGIAAGTAFRTAPRDGKNSTRPMESNDVRELAPAAPPGNGAFLIL